MVITQTPTITAKPGKSDYAPERVGAEWYGFLGRYQGYYRLP